MGSRVRNTKQKRPLKQECGYTKQQDRGVPDICISASDAPQNPHLLRILWKHGGVRYWCQSVPGTKDVDRNMETHGHTLNHVRAASVSYIFLYV